MKRISYMDNATIDSNLNFSGVYIIRSKIHPERCYIGSAKNLRMRKNAHLNDLKKNKHKNAKLQAHYNKYGVTDLVFSIVVLCPMEELYPTNGVVLIEQHFIDALKPWFNIAKVAGSSIGLKRSKESCAKIGKSKRGTPAWNKGLKGVMPTPWNKGLTKEHNETLRTMGEKIREHHTGRPSGRKGKKASVEARLHMSVAHMGRKDSEETRRKKSEALIGCFRSEETRKKLSVANMGNQHPPLTEEQHKNLSVAVKEWWRKRKENELNNKAV